jgi:hypothetical protein
MTTDEALQVAIACLTRAMKDLERLAHRFGEWETPRDREEYARMGDARQELRDLRLRGES